MTARRTSVEVPESARRLALEGPSWRLLVAGLRRPGHFFRELLRRVQEDRTLTNAAAMSYYFFFALFPMLLFVLALVSLMPLRGLDEWLVSVTVAYLPEEARTLLERTIRGILARPRQGLLSLGVLLALWSASAAFTSTIDGLNSAYRVREGRPWWQVQLRAILLTVALSILMILAFVLAVFGGQLGVLVARTTGATGTFAFQVLRWLVALALITFVVAAIYYFAPDVEQHWRWVTPGSVLFMLSFAGASAGFSAYVSHFGSYDATYGSLGAVIILLLWMYLLAFLLLVGGEVNALLEHESPAGKTPGQKHQPPGRVQLARVKQAMRRDAR